MSCPHQHVLAIGLFIVIVKQTQIGNCLPFKTNGHFVSNGESTMLGMKTFWPTCDPVIILASLTNFDNWETTNQVVLQKPADWLTKIYDNNQCK